MAGGARYCFCGELKLGNGLCINRCSPYADPRHLAAQERARHARDRYARQQERITVTYKDLLRVRRAVARFDCVAAYNSERARHAARKSHAGKCQYEAVIDFGRRKRQCERFAKMGSTRCPVHQQTHDIYDAQQATVVIAAFWSILTWRLS